MTTSPVELTLYDADAQDLVDRAIAKVSEKFPEWVPLEADMSTVLIEALATEVVESVYAINRLPEAVAETIINLNGITRSPGELPAALATITTLITTVDQAIPAGTRFAYGEHIYATLDEATVPAGQNAVTVPIVGVDLYTSSDNGTPAGTDLTLVDTVAGVLTVRLASPITDGKDPETDEEFYARATTRMGMLHATLVTPTQFSEAALAWPGVSRVVVRDRWDGDYVGTTNPVDGVPVYGREADGHITVAVVGVDGVWDKAGSDALEADMQARCVSILTVHVLGASPQGVDVTVDVVRDPDFDDATVKANITAALRTYLDPDVWPWDKYVYRNELISVIDQAPGVMRVASITLPKAAVPDYQQLGGNYPIPVLGTLTVSTSPYTSPVKIAPRTV